MPLASQPTPRATADRTTQPRQRQRLLGGWLALLVAAGSLLACGGGGGGGGGTTPPPPTQAQSSHIVADAPVAGTTPFIALVGLHGAGTENLASLRFTIAAAAGSVSKPVSVTTPLAYLIRLGRATAGGSALTLPVFGLYDNASNAVTLHLVFQDASSLDMPLTIATAAYTDPNGIYDHPNIRVARSASAVLGYDFFYLKNNLGSPVIVDTDGRIRWVTTGVAGSFSQHFDGSAFVTGSSTTTTITHVELDGTISATTPLDLAGFPTVVATDFNHNLQPGKAGLLGEIDAVVGGVTYTRSVVTEFDPATGTSAQVYDMNQILSDWMSSQGDDPTLFVRPDVDWFHNNTAIYDARDDTVIISSRENFVIKVDHAPPHAIHWIFGDTTKYWHTFPSLAAKTLSFVGAGLVPEGQHSVNIAPDGNLLLFNNGAASFNMPAGEPAGGKRSYSAVSSFAIDEAARTVTEQWHFDYGKAVFSRLCGSARQTLNGSVLVNFPNADLTTHTRIVGLDPAHAVAFDFEYANNAGCDTSWNAQPIALDALSLS